MTKVDKLGGLKTLKVAPILEELEKDRLKSTIDLVELFSSFGVELTRRAQATWACVPFTRTEIPVSRSIGRRGFFTALAAASRATLSPSSRRCVTPT